MIGFAEVGKILQIVQSGKLEPAFEALARCACVLSSYRPCIGEAGLAQLQEQHLKIAAALRDAISGLSGVLPIPESVDSGAISEGAELWLDDLDALIQRLVSASPATGDAVRAPGSLLAGAAASPAAGPVTEGGVE